MPFGAPILWPLMDMRSIGAVRVAGSLPNPWAASTCSSVGVSTRSRRARRRAG